MSLVVWINKENDLYFIYSLVGNTVKINVLNELPEAITLGSILKSDVDKCIADNSELYRVQQVEGWTYHDLWNAPRRIPIFNNETEVGFGYFDCDAETKNCLIVYFKEYLRFYQQPQSIKYDGVFDIITLN